MGVEISILNFIQNYRSPIADTLMVLMTRLGDMSLIWLVISLVLLAIPKTRKLGIYLVLALIINFIIANLILKPLVARVRPFDVNKLIKLLISSPRDYSFPSGHTSASFTIVFALFFSKTKRLEGSNDKFLMGDARLSKIIDILFVICLVFASLIAFSRLYLYVHYPTDVLGGIGVGLLSSYFAYKLAKISYLR
ncbi:phosphatase PAP2 family protein [Peptostreptococcus anaerobius]|uniref:phosphatase PAP2 family protein n=1 Tax=Peptostreptococcus anaerobius TaxID=1261 RepID=UPI001D081778|nr:phosphatase PAP2 family protein [Peptostreptococcus anaerobius]MCB6983355.1 phosphatase PAP2 family protein [Peptostreptococcus anaerobius]MCQ5151221.1 phosphatase PAP2 family protein [Peptostreptococcus anaerobius]